jgi:hypothetical protein
MRFLLDNFQKSFLHSVLHPEDSLPAEFLALIRPVGSLSAEDVITVYRNDYDARLFEALGKNYEATWILMGDEDFMQIGAEYVRHHPSSFTNLTIYGDKFCEFLVSKNVEEMILEMAYFEKNFWDIFHLSPKEPKALTPDDFQIKEFDLTHGFYLSKSCLKLHSLWLLREGGSDNLVLDDFLEDECLALFKGENGVMVKKITLVQFQILNLIRETKNLTEVFSQLDALKIETTQEEWSQIFSILSYR